MNKLLLLIFLFIPTIFFSQKLPDVTVEMLQAEQHADTFSDAAYLNKDCAINFIFTDEKIYLEYNIKERIKVYNEGGVSYGDFTISLYEEPSKKEKLVKIKGKTYNLSNGKIEKVSLSRKNDVYEEQTSDNWKRVKFAMPNVKAGSIVEVEYQIKSPYIYQLDRWYFQEDIPVGESNYLIKSPEYFIYTPVPQGFHHIEKTEKSIGASKHGEVEFLYTARNVPPVKEDEFVLNKNDYRCSVKFELYATKFPNNGAKYYSKDWDKIGQQLLNGNGFGKEINRNLKDLEPIVSQAKTLTGEARVKYIYEYVRDNVSWNGDIGINSKDGLKKFISNKTGSVADINLLLLNLLKKSDVIAYPFVGKSRNSGVLNDNFPTLTDLNYVMVYLPADDGKSLSLIHI